MLRIVDANLNRAGEGLRVLEDIARFLLNDVELSERLKNLRHELRPRGGPLQSQLLNARDSSGDVAAFAEVTAEGERSDAASIVTANSKRVQESLRVLEETAKLHPLALDWTQFKRARFAVYELERNLISKLLRQNQRGKIRGLYVIIDLQALGERSASEVARQVIRGGAKVIQLRDKGPNRKALLPVAQELKQICTSSGVLFIMNDYLDLVLAADADGMHLGQQDLPTSEARKIMPQDKVLGCSTATLEEALKAEKDGADYIAVGSIYETTSKSKFRLAGLETLHKVKEAVSIPVVAIGGIDESNIAQVITAGADAIAVISAVLGAEDVEEASRRLATEIEASEESSAKANI